MMDRFEKRVLTRLIIGAALYVAAMVLRPPAFLPENYHPWWNIGVFLPAYFIIGGDVLLRAGRNIAAGQVFDENFLMSIATVGAFCIGQGVEGVAVMLFYQVGEMFQRHAVGKSRKSITELMNIRADYANVEREGVLVQVDPEDVAVGDVIVVKPGERVPLDGKVIAGSTALDTSALTGESQPRRVLEGGEVLSGCVNISGLIRLSVTAPFEESTVARILDLVENAVSKKARSENFISKFAGYYTPAVVVSAVLLAALPPLLFAQPWLTWLRRALTFLVISCPCALVLSVPLSFFGGIGGASRKGILVKGSNYLEALAQVDTVVFDKTGTLTQGRFKVTQISPVGMEESELLKIAAHGELYSDHPIAISIKERYAEGGNELNGGEITEYEEISGHGVRLLLGGKEVLLGNSALMRQNGINYSEPDSFATVVYAAVDGKFAGHILIEDEIKPDAAQAIKALKQAGVTKAVMLTGDRKEVGESVAQRLGLDAVYTELLPADKVSIVERLLAEKGGKERGKLAFVGDGINDAPVLGRADIGIAMGAMGSDAAIEAADIVLMDDKPSKIASAVQTARKTLFIVRQNVAFALGVKALVLALGAFGLANMWGAVFADVGVSVLAILNAMRALKA